MKRLPFVFATYVPAVLDQASIVEAIELTEKTRHYTKTYHRRNVHDMPSARHGAETSAQMRILPLVHRLT